LNLRIQPTELDATHRLHFSAAQRPDNGSSGGNNPIVVNTNGQTVFGPTQPPSTDRAAFSNVTFVAISPSRSRASTN